MRLHPLLQHAVPAADLSALLATLPDVEISDVQDDSRAVQAGSLFIARPGVAADGARFAQDAVARGAVAIVTQSLIDGIAVPQCVVPDAAATVSPLANAFYGDPSKSIKLLGVTGTNGKTTTAYLIRHVLNAIDKRCGMIGTVEIDDGKTKTEAAMTTPDAVTVAGLLAAMRDNGCAACAMEVSSHALHQGRVSGVQFAGAGFTNLTGDHLDYHKTTEAYADAKAKLFEQLAPGAVAAINRDSDAFDRMTRNTAGRVVSFGMAANADYRATDFVVTAQGTKFVLTTPDGKADVSLKLVGRHNIENALCTITLCCEVFGLSVQPVVNTLQTATGAPGRLQSVETGQPFAVLVDYAHTDDALRNVLSAMRPITRGKLRVVFGCGGDRDRTKRPRMAKIAEQLADEIYVTSDNPRTENPQAILEEVCTGFGANSGKRVSVEADRRLAIERAIGDAGPGDVVLIAGKGHENYQIIGQTKYHFDDVEEAARALTAVRV
ncbi:MAG: murE [Phycisphaerales bacterium]|nr:murE [Phycisphaerales bacterium]